LKQELVIKWQGNWEICNNQERESIVVIEGGQMLGDYETSEKRKVKIGTQNWEMVLDRRQLVNNIWNRQVETLCTLITFWAGERGCGFTVRLSGDKS
jgi:hypothetical protein